MMIAYFYDEPNSPMEKKVWNIFRANGGLNIGAGTRLTGDRAGERGVRCDMPDENVESVRGVLEKIGYRVKVVFNKKRKFR